MKALFTAAALVLTVCAHAYYGETKLTVSPTGKSNIRVMIDGNRYNRSTNGTLVVKDLSPGYHTIRVMQKRGGSGTGWNDRVNNGYQVVYSGQVYLKPQYHTDISITRFGKVQVDEQQMGAGYTDEDEDDNDWNGRGDNDSNWNNRDNGNGGDCTNGGGNNGGGWGTGNNRAMDARTFEQFKQTLRNESFDNTRLSIARQTIGAGYVSAQQVRDVVSLFSFETSKLDIAKFAYRYTVDKNGYFLVNDAFSYSSSKEELNNYIRNYR